MSKRYDFMSWQYSYIELCIGENRHVHVYWHFRWREGGRRSPAVACWASDHWVASSNPLRGKFRGGVAIYINSNLNFTRHNDLEIFLDGQFESIFIEIKSKASPLIVGEIYRVPNTSEHDSIERYETILKISELQKYNCGNRSKF